MGACDAAVGVPNRIVRDIVTGAPSLPPFADGTCLQDECRRLDRVNGPRVESSDVASGSFGMNGLAPVPSPPTAPSRSDGTAIGVETPSAETPSAETPSAETPSAETSCTAAGESMLSASTEVAIAFRAEICGDRAETPSLPLPPPPPPVVLPPPLRILLVLYLAMRLHITVAPC